MQIARSDCCPFVVDQHDLSVDVDIATPTLRIQPGNSKQSEIFIHAELCHLIEEQPGLRVAACCTDTFLRLGRHQR